MKKICNTKIKKIWIIWLFLYLIIIFVTIFIAKFLTNNKITSNIFFGYAVISLAILLFAFFTNKKKTNNNIHESVILDYFEQGYKITNNSSQLVTKKRIIYISCYGLVTFIISSLTSLLFAYL